MVKRNREGLPNCGFRSGNGMRTTRGPRLLTEMQLYWRPEDLFGAEEARRLMAPPPEPVTPTNPYDEIAKFAVREEGTQI